MESGIGFFQDTKICADCKNVKPTNEYYSKGKRREHVCKPCSNLRRKKKRIALKKKSRRKRSKNHTLTFDNYQVVGDLVEKEIEIFSFAYARLIQEALYENE